MARNFGRPINRIVGHCTGTTQQATRESIETFWSTPKTNAQTGAGKPYIPNVQGGSGWRSPGYHYLFGTRGQRYILQHLSQIVNGARGFNWDSVHFSWIGGRDGVNDMTEEQEIAIVQLINELRSDEILGPVPVVGHRDLSPDLNGDGIITPNEFMKLCPAFNMSDFLVKHKIQ